MLSGREKELQMLSEMYNSKHFRFLVMFGRRHAGKTSILREFAKKKDVIFYSAQAKNDSLNLADFSAVLHRHFGNSDSGPFSDWENAFAYLTSHLSDKRLVIIIEEFHFIALEYPSIVGLLQRTIDRSFRTKNVFLILCGSDVNFAEGVMLGYDSPLYGRLSGQMIVSPLDYLDSGRLLPDYTAESKLLSYGILGGIPCYTRSFDPSVSVADNVALRILSDGSYLRDEPQTVLRGIFREPAVYNSILESVALGCSRMNDIAMRTHEESQKCAKYLNTLRANLLIDKITPVGEDDYSKKSLYAISDNFFCFWYRFIFSSKSSLELMEPGEAARVILSSDSFMEYMHDVLRKVCREYLVRKADAGKLPFTPSVIGRWWSGSSRRRKCGEIDVVAADKDRNAAIYGKCSFGRNAMTESDLDELISSGKGFGKTVESYYYLFSRSGFSDGLKGKAKKNKNIKLLEIEDLYKI